MLAFYLEQHNILGDGSNTILNISRTASEQPNCLIDGFLFDIKLKVAFPNLLTSCPSVLALPNIGVCVCVCVCVCVYAHTCIYKKYIFYK